MAGIVLSLDEVFWIGLKAMGASFLIGLMMGVLYIAV
jgi:hypothetical protein